MSRRLGLGAFVVAGLTLAVLLAFVVAPHASSSPDGLEKVAADQALDTGAGPHTPANGPLADYSVAVIDDPGISTGVAGLIGVAVTFGLTLGLSKALEAGRRRTRDPVTT